MKLWEAILLGSKLKPATNDVWINGCRSCAAGAAIDAMGLYPDAYEDSEIQPLLNETWPWTIHFTRCPFPGCSLDDDVSGVLTCLMHHCDGNRERIALDFVKPLEEKWLAEQAQVEPTAVDTATLAPVAD